MSLYVDQIAAELAAAYEAGDKMDDICAKYFVTGQTVRRVVYSTGGTIRRRGAQGKRGKQLDWVEEVKHVNSNPCA